jgi:hypothetical protein
MRDVNLINSEHPSLIDINPVVFVSWLQNLLNIAEQKYTDLNYLYPLYKLVSDPGIHFENYIDRISTYYYLPKRSEHSQKSILPFIYASFFLIIYIEKNQECLSGDVFQSIHKLFAAAFQLGAKLFYDEFPVAQQAAFVYGMNVNELQTLEWDFFARINGDVRASTIQINQLTKNYLHHLQLAYIPKPVIYTLWNFPVIYSSTDVRQLVSKFHP